MTATAALPNQIHFACSGCGKKFAVPLAYAGRKANCKTCGSPIIVPQPPESTASEIGFPAAVAEVLRRASENTPVEHSAPLPARSSEFLAARPAAPKLPMRTRRLLADAQQMQQVFAEFPLIRVLPATGDPPEIYQIEYKVKGLRRGWLGRPKLCEEHKVEIRLTSDYPRLAPHCRMLTPIFHPNIDPTTICVGDHWTAGERLVDLVIRIAEMIGYQAYNIRSPLDGEAAMWADLHPQRLPIDPRSMRPAERDIGH